MNKTLFGVIFIISAAIVLVTMDQFGIFIEYIYVLIIPILMIAFSLGQYSERKFGKKES